MQTFLILISFILNIIALLAIVLLYTRQNRLLEVEKRQEKAVSEMEDLISSYLFEMKEENDRFIQQFKAVKEVKSESSQEKVNKIKHAAEKVLQPERDSPEKDKDLYNSHSYRRQNAVKAYTPKNANEMSSEYGENTPASETLDKDPFIHQIQILQGKGYTIEEIARELGKGVTEIELLLKFRQSQK
jgi:hypothetical protein